MRPRAGVADLAEQLGHPLVLEIGVPHRQQIAKSRDQPAAGSASGLQPEDDPRRVAISQEAPQFASDFLFDVRRTAGPP